MLDKMKRGFIDGFHYQVSRIAYDSGSNSNIEMESHFMTFTPEEVSKLPHDFNPRSKAVPTVE